MNSMLNQISSYFFFILLIGAVIAAVMIFLPFLTPLILAAAAAVMAYPLHRSLLRVFGYSSMSRTLAAFATVILILLVILVPMFFLVGKIYSEIQLLYGSLTDEGSRSEIINTLNSGSQWLSDHLFGIMPTYSFDSLNVTQLLKNALGWVFSNLDKIFGSIAGFAAYVLVFLIALFYFLRDGATLKQRFVTWSPLLDENDEYLTKTMKKAIRSVFAGTFTVSVVQGILTGVGFLIFGIPAPALWGSVAAVASMVPGVGTALVIVPGIIYLFVTGSYAYAIGLALWGALAVGMIDNLLGPYVVNKGMNIHPFLILISVLGGLATFGIIGFILGPLILALLFALLEIYRTSFSGKTETARRV